ncbi:MAG: AAA family ATPase [Candidatus Omnitrophica bacterium]|nr:AAA family ATPase [Candidatus Omnitrophota bacterium]
MTAFFAWPSRYRRVKYIATMHLIAFRIQNYKKIRDTDWVLCENLTVMVGKNEAGKSCLFRGLSKLNPSDGEKYDGLKEFPRSRYTKEFQLQDWPVATGRFALSEEERKHLSDLAPSLNEVKEVEFTRHYSWSLSTFFKDFSESPIKVEELRSEFAKAIKQIEQLTAPEGKGEQLTALKKEASGSLQRVLSSLPASGDVTKDQAVSALSAINTSLSEEWQKNIFRPILEILQPLASRAETNEKHQAAKNWAVGLLPKFVYFANYDMLESAIHIPGFLTSLQQVQKQPKQRVTLCLFKHVGLDLQDMLRLSSQNPGQGFKEEVRRRLDELSIKSNSASIAMTAGFRDWWEQREHRFRYDFQGEYFRIWVSDDIDASDVELDQRSTGLQYFFSFYLVFLVEAGEAHKNCILLLDEPGLHLHGTAQLKVVQFLRKISKGSNQVLYSTHSPFMIDANHLESARAVFEGDDGTTKVSADVWPRDKDSLFPLQAALGYNLVQSLFLSKKQVIVEGITDFWLLKALDQAMSVKGKMRLRQDLTLVPSAGLSKLLPLASMLIGHEVEVAALLDGDEPARKEGKKLVEKLLAGQDRKCLFIGDFLDNKAGEVEDIFPEDEYLKAVREAYPGVDLDFDKAEKKLPGVVDKIKGLFERKNIGPFEKWKPAAVLRDSISANPDKVSDFTCDILQKINEAIDSLFSSTASTPSSSARTDAPLKTTAS